VENGGNWKAAVQAAFRMALDGKDEAGVITTGADLIEYLSWELSPMLADERAMAVLRMRENGLTDVEITQKTGLSSQKIRKLSDRGAHARKLRAASGQNSAESDADMFATA
jgi:hypothetical protein